MAGHEIAETAEPSEIDLCERVFVATLGQLCGDSDHPAASAPLRSRRRTPSYLKYNSNIDVSSLPVSRTILGWRGKHQILCGGRNHRSYGLTRRASAPPNIFTRHIRKDHDPMSAALAWPASPCPFAYVVHRILQSVFSLAARCT